MLIEKRFFDKLKDLAETNRENGILFLCFNTTGFGEKLLSW